MAKKKDSSGPESEAEAGLGAILKGLGGLVERLGELADTGREISKVAEVHGQGPAKEIKGVYGFTVKVGLGGEGATFEPFGNIRREPGIGRAVVHEVMEPAVDIFQERDHTLVVAELPGISAEDVRLEVKDDVLTLVAERGTKKYRKEVLLPDSFALEKMQVSCTNGVLEIRCVK